MSEVIGQGQGIGFYGMLQSSMRQIEAALPKHLTPERMIRTALTAFRQSALLAKADPKSVLAAVFIAAQLGLEVGVNGECYLLPFWNARERRYDCQLIVGYQGYIKLARNTGMIESIETRVIHDGDTFEVEYGLTPRFRHVPVDREGDRNPVGAYCIARFVGGGLHIEYMTWREIMAIKARSPSKNKEGKITGPWVTDPEEMARKTVVRRARKYWPQSVELATANVYDGHSATLSVEQLMGPPEVVPSVDGDADALEHDSTTGTGIQMPQAKSAEPVVVEREEPEHQTGEAVQRIQMTDGQRNVLRAKLKGAKIDEQAIIDTFSHNGVDLYADLMRPIQTYIDNKPKSLA